MKENLNRHDVWYLMSDIFVEDINEYDYVARELNHLPLDELKVIFFNEVAPVFKPKILTSVYIIDYGGYNREYVVSSISNHIKNYQNSSLYRIKSDILMKIFDKSVNEKWKKLKNYIDKYHQNPKQ